MSHYTEAKFPIGSLVYFKPKGLLNNVELTGVVVNHIYWEVLIIKEDKTGYEWWVSAKRTKLIDPEYKGL